MKTRLMIALLVCAIPAVAFGQIKRTADPQAPTVTARCEGIEECDQIPYFKGEGGFAGMAAKNAEGMYGDVEFITTCGSMVSQKQEAMVGDNGVVVEGFFDDNGLACMEGGTMLIHGLERGGWYWINGNRNVSVSTLLRDDVVGDDSGDHPGTMLNIKPPVPPGVQHEEMEHATLLTGQHGVQGILPHFQPDADHVPCSDTVQKDCLFNPRYELMAMHGMDMDMMMVGETIERPMGDMPLEVTFQVQGHGNLFRDAGNAHPSAESQGMVSWVLSAPHVPTAAAPDFMGDDLASYGLAENAAGLTILPAKDSWCTTEAPGPPVTVTAKVMVAMGMNEDLFPDPGSDMAYEKTFTITCP